ncbi:unnamed protein product [Moneuplotes crassus]|uniref:Uncharacterized protein n=1 Tax=Euplotes crassus TaxID=5936 RepID=A0AAD1Y2W7_EUPCR|nr:unnamed protein product [Moneuplotes crassus]
MEIRNVNDMSKFIIESVKTLSQKEGVSDKQREDALKFLNGIMKVGFKFPENLLKSMFEILIAHNLSETRPEFIILASAKTFNRLIDEGPKLITQKEDKRILLAFVEKFKHYVRNCEKYSKDVIEEFLKIMLKVISLLDYDGAGTIFPLISVTAVKTLIYVIPGVNGMIQSYLLRIWQIACLKVIGDSSFFMQKYFKDEAEEQKISNSLTLEEFLNPKKENVNIEEARTKNLDKPWLMQCASKVQDCMRNIDNNFQKLAEKNNLKTFNALSEFVEHLISVCSNIFLFTENYEIFLTSNAVYNYCRVLTTESPEGEGIKHRVNLRSLFPSSEYFSSRKSAIMLLLESTVQNLCRKLKKEKHTLSLLKLESLFKYSNDCRFTFKEETFKKLYISLLTLVEVKNTKVTLLKEGSGLTEVFDKTKLAPTEIEDDIDLFLCNELTYFENSLEAYYGLHKIFLQFPVVLCGQIYSQIVKDVELIDSDEQYSHKAYGFIKKSSLYFLLSCLMGSIKHDLHDQCLEFVLEKMKDTTELKYPVQKTYITVLLMVLKNCIINTDSPNLKLKNKIFTEIFTLLSHKFDCVNKAALLCIELVKRQEGCSSISQIISSRHGVFWSNVFSYIKYLDLMNKNTTKIYLIFRSLKTYGYVNFKENLDDVIEYLSQAIDHFLEINDWNSLMVIFDLIGITSELIKDHVTAEDKQFANLVKNLLLRIKQFFTATRSRKLVSKSIDIFKNCIPYLSDVGFSLEDAKNFSDEDPENTLLNDGLGILVHKFYEDLLFILKEKDYSAQKSHSRIGMSFEAPGFSNTSNHISVVRFFIELNKYRKEFLTIGHRYRDIFDCMIERFSSYEDSDSSLQNQLVKEYLVFYDQIELPQIEEGHEYLQKLELIDSLVTKVRGILENVK